MSAETESTSMVEGYYFSASSLKLAVMCVCTLGLYEVFWFYKNWVLIKERSGTSIMPVWRSVFSPIWAYSCFKRIGLTAIEKQMNLSVPAGLLAVAYFVLNAFAVLKNAYSLIALFTCIPLLFANNAATVINRHVDGSFKQNSKFSIWNWLVIIPVGMLLILTLIGLVLQKQ